LGFIYSKESLLPVEDNKDALPNNVDDLDHKYANNFNGDEPLHESAMLRRRLRYENTNADDAKLRDVCRQIILKLSVHDLLTWIFKTGARQTFGNFVIVLQLVLAIAISVASCERSFSKLKLLKMYLRSTINQTRLRGLSIISI